MESVAGSSSHRELRVEEVPLGTVCLLASCCLPVEQPGVMVLHLMMPRAACALCGVLSISHCYFQCLCFNTGLQVGREE